MPVTKTAKRALRGSLRKQKVNVSLMTRLEIAIRKAKKVKNQDSIKNATSLTDRAVKKRIIHQNKATRIKSQLLKLLPTKKSAPKKPRKTSKK